MFHIYIYHHSIDQANPLSHTASMEKQKFPPPLLCVCVMYGAYGIISANHRTNQNKYSLRCFPKAYLRLTRHLEKTPPCYTFFFPLQTSFSAFGDRQYQINIVHAKVRKFQKHKTGVRRYNRTISTASFFFLPFPSAPKKKRANLALDVVGRR